jgi:hypothetical protein
VDVLLVTIKELAQKYEIPLVEVEDHIEFVLSQVLSERFNTDVQVFLEDGTPKIYSFTEEAVFEIDPKRIPKEVILQAKEKIEYKLNCLNAYKILLEAKKLTRTVVVGTIRKIINKDLYVEFKNPKAMTKKGETLIGVCPYAHQTPKERSFYKVGMVLPFLVTSVRGEIIDGTPRIIITLSRNSIAFPVILLKTILEEAGIFVRLKPVKRIAGAYTIIQASERIPKEYIKKVSHILKEGIIVKF